MKINQTRKIFKSSNLNIFNHLPLEAPMILNIDPSSGCNFKCFFCPTGNPDLLKGKEMKSTILKESTFLKILTSIKEFKGKIKRVNFYKLGEPLLNKNLEKYIQMTEDSGRVEEISTTSNASLLFKKRSEQLIKAGLSHINISVEHVSSEGYKKVTKVYDNYDQIKKNIKDFYELKEKLKPNLLMRVKIADTNLSKDEILKFENEFSDYCDLLNVEYLHNWHDVGKSNFNDKKKTNFTIDGTSTTEDVKICSEPFFYMGVQADGKVSACTPDWSDSMVMGDVKINSLKEIWNGEKYKKLRQDQIKNRFKINVCKNCKFPNQARVFQRIDKYKKELEKKYFSKK